MFLLEDIVRIVDGWR